MFYSRTKSIELMNTYNKLPSVCHGFTTLSRPIVNHPRYCGTHRIVNTEVFEKLLLQLLGITISKLSIQKTPIDSLISY